MSVAVRRAIPGDEPVLRALRLEAMTDAPDAFGSTYERELARTVADWQRWLSPNATFVLDGSDGPRGIAAGVHDADDSSVVHLMAMWVHPTLRGTGAADARARLGCYGGGHGGSTQGRGAQRAGAAMLRAERVPAHGRPSRPRA